MTEVKLHPSASRDMRNAAEWYLKASAKVARRFLAEVDRIVAEIADNPERFAWHDEPFREAPLKRFPYRLIYRIEPNGSALIFAVAHASRKPDYWRGRV